MAAGTVTKDALFGLENRRNLFGAPWRNALLPVLSIVAALAVGAVVLLLAGYNVADAYAALWQGVFGNTRNIGEAFLRAEPLIFIGAGLAVAFRCGIWNIGAEGQFYLGAIGGTFIGLHVAGLNAPMAILLAVAAGFLCGGVWASIAGWLKVRLGLNEVVTTIMLNYIATGVVSFLINGPMQEAAHANPQTDEIAASVVLPRIWLPTRVDLGFPIAAVRRLSAGLHLVSHATGLFHPGSRLEPGGNQPLRGLMSTASTCWPWC